MKRPVHVLWCPNARRGRSNGWSFPPTVGAQLRADFAGKSILHLFGGRSTFGTRMDIDPIVTPDVIADAWLPPFGYKFVALRERFAARAHGTRHRYRATRVERLHKLVQDGRLRRDR